MMEEIFRRGTVSDKKRCIHNQPIGILERTPMCVMHTTQRERERETLTPEASLVLEPEVAGKRGRNG